MRSLITKIQAAGLTLLCCMLVCIGIAFGEVSLTAEPLETGAGGVVDVRVEAGEGAESVVYTLLRNGEKVFQGKEDIHFQASFRPRKEGEYTVEAEVRYADGSTGQGRIQIAVNGETPEEQGPDRIYSQKDGWWKDKAYSKSDLDTAGCAIFTLSHVLQRMGWTGPDIAPEQLAVTYRNCLVKNGTAVARLVYNASLVYGFTTNSALVKDASSLREGLDNGDYYSFSIVLGHIALMTGIDGKAGKVCVVDSAPSATFERIKKGKIYILRDGSYEEVQDPGEIPGARYYFETGYYGGLTYYMDLDYCARRGGRLIRPAWVYYLGNEGRIGASMISFSSGECEIKVNDTRMTVPTRELIWGDGEKPMLALVPTRKAVRLLNDAGKRIATIPGRTVVPVLREEEDRVYVLAEEQRGYVLKSDIEMIEPVQGEIMHGTVSVGGNTSGRATVKMRFGPSGKERVADQWKTGTPVILISKEDEFWLVEGKGVRLWVHQDYITAENENGT